MSATDQPWPPTLQVAGRRAHKLSSSSLEQTDPRKPQGRYPRGDVQVTQAVAARYIVLWRVIRVVLVARSSSTFMLHQECTLLVGSTWDVNDRALRSLLEWAKYNPAFSVSR